MFICVTRILHVHAALEFRTLSDFVSVFIKRVFLLLRRCFHIRDINNNNDNDDDVRYKRSVCMCMFLGRRRCAGHSPHAPFIVIKRKDRPAVTRARKPKKKVYQTDQVLSRCVNVIIHRSLCRRRRWNRVSVCRCDPVLARSRVHSVIKKISI